MLPSKTQCVYSNCNYACMFKRNYVNEYSNLLYHFILMKTALFSPWTHLFFLSTQVVCTKVQKVLKYETIYKICEKFKEFNFVDLKWLFLLLCHWKCVFFLIFRSKIDISVMHISLRNICITKAVTPYSNQTT